MLSLSTRPYLDTAGPVCGKQEEQKLEVPRPAAVHESLLLCNSLRVPPHRSI